MLKRLVMAAALLMPMAAFAQATPVGVWKTIDDQTQKETSWVRIVDSGGTLSGKVDKLLSPGAKQDGVCDKCTDDRKDKPTLGLEIIRGAKRNADDPLQWDGGEILDPGNGKNYRLRLKLSEDGKQLNVRGYIGTPMIGRSQTWYRVE